MRITDWKFDFSSLPHWNDRDTILWIYDEFFDIPQSDTLCCIYSVAEVSMCNYLGHLAILKNKEKPELLLNVDQGMSFCDNVSVSTDGSLIFLQPDIRYKRPVLIIDITKNIFSYVLTDNHNPCYKIVESGRNVFAIEADAYQKKNDKLLKALCRRKIRINSLRWYSLDKLESLPEMIR